MEHPHGWTCEVTLLQLTAYLSDALPWGRALAVAEHLEACPNCAQRLLLLSQEPGGRLA